MIELLKLLLKLFLNIVAYGIAGFILLSPFIFLLIFLHSYNVKKYKEKMNNIIMEYEKESYFMVTKFPYYVMMNDTGKYGEYLIFKSLKNFENVGAKFLFNIYVPKNNDETTEIDILLITRRGIFVFESKNFNGWIFGNEKEKYWCQTLPSGHAKSHKEKFYNPVLQNGTHIKFLRNFVDNDIPIHSVIVFSDHCVLKKVHVNNKNISVVNLRRVFDLVSSIYNFNKNVNINDETLSKIYNMLFSFTQVDDFTRQKHIDNINSIK